MTRWLATYWSSAALGLVGAAALVLSAGKALGLWSPPWFQAAEADVTLSVVCLLAAALLAQHHRTSAQLVALEQQLASGHDGAVSLLGNLCVEVTRLRGSQLASTLAGLGVVDVWQTGAAGVPEWKERIGHAKTLDLVAVTARQWATNESERLPDLIKQGLHVHIVLASPRSAFVRQLEKREDLTVAGTLAKDIDATVSMLRWIKEHIHAGAEGSLEVRRNRGEIPHRAEIIDGLHMHWTPYIPPTRGFYVPAFHVSADSQGALGKMLTEYFAMVWNESGDDVIVKWPEEGPLSAADPQPSRAPISPPG
jgi:hypothetical protein